MAQHKFNFRLITRDDSTAAACGAWRGQEADRAQDQDGGRRSFVAGRTPKPVAGIEISGPDDEVRCRKSFFEPAGHSRDSTGGLEFGGLPYVRGAEFQEMGGPGSSSGRRGAGRERSAAVVEHRGILGKACRDGRLPARPARSGHLALAEAREPHAIFCTAAAVIGARGPVQRPQVDHEPLRQSRGGACCAGDADAVSLRGICSRTMRNVVGP